MNSEQAFRLTQALANMHLQPPVNKAPEAPRKPPVVKRQRRTSKWLKPISECPECHSVHVKRLQSGDYRCRRCNHLWKPGADEVIKMLSISQAVHDDK